MHLCVLAVLCASAEFFDLISKAQSNRNDDQRGLLNKSDLQLPDFLRLSPAPANTAHGYEFNSSTPNSRNPQNGGFPGSSRRGNKPSGNERGFLGGSHLLSASHHSQSLDSGISPDRGRKARPPPSFPSTTSPVHPTQLTRHQDSIQMLEEDAVSDLTLVGEGDINSPSLHYITPSALPCTSRPISQIQDRRPSSGTPPV